MSKRVVIIDYGSGNLHSARKAFERAARDSGQNREIMVSADRAVVAAADRIVLPGVGAYADCRRGLDAIPGMVETLDDVVRRRGRPFLGICVGMQLMATRGLEFGETQGLGWIAGDVVAIEPADPALKIPHMGWNTLDARGVGGAATRDQSAKPHALLTGLPTGPGGLHAYFVHSFHLKAADPADVVATTDYGGAVTAIVARDNMGGTQFHPEKSQRLGLGLIANFLAWRP